MMAMCVAVLGKDNAPIYVTCSNPSLELQFLYKVHTSLDFIEEKVSVVGKGSSDTRDFYLGMLYSTEDDKLYGYVTNTKIKFVLVIDASNMVLRDNEIRMMFRTLHSAYVDMISNPFFALDELHISPKFMKFAKSIMEDIV